MRVAFRSDPEVIWRRLEEAHGALAFDVGANGGDVANLLAQRFKRVVAFEPCFESYAELVTRAADNVVVLRMAASSKSGSVELVAATHAIATGQLVTGDSLAYSWGEPVERRTVPATTLDDAVAVYGLPDFVKIDTEGHEVEVLRGGMALFAHARPHLLVEVHAAANGDTIRDLLPWYRFERIDHDGYPTGSYGRANHFYLVGA